jgi:hypothetical protein
LTGSVGEFYTRSALSAEPWLRKRLRCLPDEKGIETIRNAEHHARNLRRQRCLPDKKEKGFISFAAAGRLRSPAFLRREPMKPFSVTTTLH